MLFIGNKKVVENLQRSLERGLLNHAYIFSGPEHVGKFTLAKMFALGAIGGAPLAFKVDEFDKDAMLDLIVVAPEIVEKKNISKQRDISIETIREVKKSLSLFPYHGKYKILIIEDAHRMNGAAQNALLKILEEPNQTTIIILVTHEVDRILPTLQSRSQMVNFGLVSDAEMQKSFAKDIVSLAAGRPGIASLISQDENERVFRAEAIEDLKKIANGSLNEKFLLAEEFSKDIVKTLDKMNAWLWEIRKNALSVPSYVLHTSPDASRHPLLEKEREEMNEIFRKIEKIQKSMEMLKRTNASGRLILETLFMDLGQ